MDAMRWLRATPEFPEGKTISTIARHGNGLRFHSEGSDYFLRLCDKGSAAPKNARLASAAGWAPPFITGNEEGYVVGWISQARAPLAAKEKSAARSLLDRVHASGVVFPETCGAENALRISAARQEVIPADLDRWIDLARALAKGTPLSPMHGDPHPENFLMSPDGLYLIDWEFAGMGDRDWDLGYWSHAAGVAPENERVRCYAELAAQVWALWER